jgi:hypothetical protein
MDKERIVNYFMKEFNNSSDKVNCLNNFFEKINSLQIKTEEKIKIFEYLYQVLSLPSTTTNGYFLLNESTENRFYLKLITKAMANLKDKKNE